MPACPTAEWWKQCQWDLCTLSPSLHHMLSSALLLPPCKNWWHLPAHRNKERDQHYNRHQTLFSSSFSGLLSQYKYLQHGLSDALQVISPLAVITGADGAECIVHNSHKKSNLAVSCHYWCWLGQEYILHNTCNVISRSAHTYNAKLL